MRSKARPRLLPIFIELYRKVNVLKVSGLISSLHKDKGCHQGENSLISRLFTLFNSVSIVPVP